MIELLADDVEKLSRKTLKQWHRCLIEDLISSIC